MAAVSTAKVKLSPEEGVSDEAPMQPSTLEIRTPTHKLIIRANQPRFKWLLFCPVSTPKLQELSQAVGPCQDGADQSLANTANAVSYE